MRRRRTRVQPAAVVCCLHAAILWRFILWASLQQWMRESYAMSRKSTIFAERIQQRRKRCKHVLVSYSSSPAPTPAQRTIPPRYRRRRPLLKFWLVPRQRASAGDARSVPRYTTAPSGPCRPYVICRVDGVWLYLSSLSLVCLLYTSPSPRDATLSRMPSSA